MNTATAIGALIIAGGLVVWTTGPDIPTVGRLRVRCADFKTQQDAQAALSSYPYLDGRDKDGVACEGLP